jgi:fructosamine-3-kinase
MDNDIQAKIKSRYGNTVKIKSKERCYGGCINKSYIFHLTNLEKVFVKFNTPEIIKSFESEAKALSIIKNNSSFDVPTPLFTGIENNESYLMLSYVEEGRKKKSFFEDFAIKLNSLHNNTSTFFGYETDGADGPILKPNTPNNSWIDFFRSTRLEYQIRIAEPYFSKSELRGFLQLLDNLDKYLIEPDKPSLLHGDLWNGNFMVNNQGEPVLIDPALYYGHREEEIAFTRLFGGFDESFYEIYKTLYDLNGFEDRLDLYNLYHLLVHLNLFKNSYLESCLTIMKKYTK